MQIDKMVMDPVLRRALCARQKPKGIYMKILSLRTINGPNVYHSLPVLVMKLNLLQWTDSGSHQLPGFNSKLLSILPGLIEHTCSPGVRGGFCQRLERGTYLAHTAEHIAIELSCLCGMPVRYGKTRFAGVEGHYNVIVRFLNEEAMSLCLKKAVELIEALLLNKNFAMEKTLQQIRRLEKETKLGPSGQALWDAAIRRNIPVRRLAHHSLLELGYGKYLRRLQAAVSDRTGLIAADLVQDKNATKSLLAENGIPVPEGVVVHTEEEALLAQQNLAGLCAIKPGDGHHGNGVSLNLKSWEDIQRAFWEAKKFSNEVLIEEMCEGKDFRVLVINGKFSAAAERSPPSIKGDGVSTVLQLIEKINQEPGRGEGHSSVLSEIEIDDLLLENLKKQNLNMDLVPTANQVVILKENANLSSGGTALDVTSTVHPEIRAVCERISRILGLDICGIDLIASSLSLSRLESRMKVIEVNACPGLRMHLAPSDGTARPVADEIIQMLYPLGAISRIPIVAVTGTNGKTTTVRLIHKILSQSACVGLTTSDGVYIGNEQIATGDTTGPQSARMLLSDSSVEKAVFEVARGGLLRGGLAYDHSDVGIITNIRPDHIGQDGIEDLEDLVWIKSLVADSVKENGVLILNADDEQSAKLQFRPSVQKRRKKFIFYSLSANNPLLLQHLIAGGDACWLEDGWIVYRENLKLYRLIASIDLAFALGGLAKFQVSNALAAVAGARSMHASFDEIVAGLRSFSSTFENSGRLNLYKVGEGYLILDYGHNPDAITAIGELLSQWKNFRKTAVFGLPGDRADHVLEMSAQKVSEIFDCLILRDDLDLRGRKPGEVPDLIAAMIKQTKPEMVCKKILDEEAALKEAMSQIRKDEIVVVFYDVFPAVMQMLRQYDPVPISMIPLEPFTAMSEIRTWTEPQPSEPILSMRAYP